MKLAELQQAFWSLATRAPTENDRISYDPAAIFVGNADLNAATRIEIYADMFVWRQVDCLREDFPKLAAVLGDEAFFALADAYLRAHPSRHHSLAKLGRYLPTFLGEHAQPRSDLRDLAALEWARVEVFDEQDIEVAGDEALSRLAADPNQALRFVPALRRLHLPHAVFELWQEIERGSPASLPRAVSAGTNVVVWRKDYEVFHVQLEPHEIEAFDRAAAGAPLAVICEAFENQANPVVSAFRTIASWYAEGWVAADPK
jgi:hypothetical protein